MNHRVTPKMQDGPGLRADVGIQGVWTHQGQALFNIKVIDTGAPSHMHQTPESILDQGKEVQRYSHRYSIIYGPA